MFDRSLRILITLTLALLVTLPSVSAAPGSQTIHYAKDQAFLNMDGPFIAGDSGALCYGLPSGDDLVSGDPSVVEDLRVGGCGYSFAIPRAETGATAILHLEEWSPGAEVGIQWRLVDASGAACDGGDASGVGQATATFTVLDGCRTVWFLASDTVTAGTITLSWSA